MNRKALLLSIALLANVATAVGVVSVKHESRSMRTQLQNLRFQYDKLRTVHAQLRLEKSSWANPDRISRLARRNLDMHQPQHAIVVRSNG